MKRKRNGTTTCSALFNSSSKSKQQTLPSYYLPDECWESIFRFIIINDNINNHYLNSLSLVSKQFLSITNRLLFSLTVYKPHSSIPIETTNFLRLLKRLTNLTSLNLKSLNMDLNNLLCQSSYFPLKQLTSINISYQHNFPTNGLLVFSQKITTLTSLTCSNIHILNPSDLFLIAECFPLLEQLDISYPVGCKNHSSYVDGVEALSLALIKLRKVNLSGFPINNQSLFHFFNNCKHLEEAIIFKCDEITDAGLASALRERPTLRSLSFSTMERTKVLPTSELIDSLVSLKGLTCLILHFWNVSNELLYSIAREGLPLTRFGLLHCNVTNYYNYTTYSYVGIFRLLSKCQRIQHLDLQYTDFLKDQHFVTFSPFLVDLVSINLSHCSKLTKSALFTLAKNCPSLSEIKMERIGNKVAWNSDSFEEFGVYPQLKSLYLGNNSWLNDEIITMFASIFPNLQLLDLINCNGISEGICEVLKKCCKIRHLNLAYCSRVEILGMNFVVPNLEVLNLTYTNVDDETLYLISKNCCGLLQLSLKFCIGVTKKGVKHVIENCKQLRKINVIGIPLSYKNGKLFSRHGCRIYN